MLRGSRSAIHCSRGTPRPRYQAKILVGPLTLLPNARGDQRLRLQERKGELRVCACRAAAAAGSVFLVAPLAHRNTAALAGGHRPKALLRRRVAWFGTVESFSNCPCTVVRRTHTSDLDVGGGIVSFFVALSKRRMSAETRLRKWEKGPACIKIWKATKGPCFRFRLLHEGRGHKQNS